MQRTYYTSKDEESDLGDYGVRKYDDLTGRFTATDPLWEKYYGWSPYVYSGNDPVNLIDLDGRDIIVLLDKEGANGLGHSAVLIGNDDSGWNLFSKNGGTLGLWGKSDRPDKGLTSFKTLDKFYQTKDDLNNELKIERYDLGFRISSSEKEDGIMRQEAQKQVLESYDIFNNSCNHTQWRVLDAIGVQPGRSSIPNNSFQDLIQWNNNLNNGRTFEKININEERSKIK